MKQRKAFTMLELIVAMGIFILLTGLGIYAFQIAQRSSRDNNRKNVLADMSKIINDYRSQYLRYPSADIVGFEADSLQIDGVSVLTLDSYKTYGVITDQSSTLYYYQNTTGGYMLCAKLESGGVVNAGTVNCTNQI